MLYNDRLVKSLARVEVILSFLELHDRNGAAGDVLRLGEDLEARLSRPVLCVLQALPLPFDEHDLPALAELGLDRLKELRGVLESLCKT